MGKYSIEIGKRIKYYRKKRNFSVSQMAEMIYKGKSTIYKYENGSIPIDVETLHDIANALEVPIACFLDSSPSDSLTKDARLPFSQSNVLYFYCFINHTLVKSKMDITYHSEKGIREATMYYHMSSFSEVDSCEYMYRGEMECFDFITYFNMVNTLSAAERVNIYIFNPLQQEHHTWGIMFGLLNFPLAPAACKVLVSSDMIEENSPLLSELILTKEDLAKIKNKNLFNLFYNINRDAVH